MTWKYKNKDRIREGKPRTTLDAFTRCSPCYQYHIIKHEYRNVRSVLTFNWLKQGPAWQLNSSPSRQELPRIQRKQTAPNRVHTSPPHVSNLREINPCPSPPVYSFNINFSTVLPPTHRSSNFTLSFTSPHPNPTCISLLPHMYCMLRPSQTAWFRHSSSMWNNYA